MLSAKDFFKKSTYNCDTKNQLWCSIIADAHDSNCGCDYPFAHLLASIFPPGHADRNLTINQILERDYYELCLSGGTEEKGHGSTMATNAAADTDGKENQGDGYIEDEELQKLIDAGEDAAGTR